MWSNVEDLLFEGVEEKLFSGCALCVRTLDEELFLSARGHAEIRPNKRIASIDTIWDIASLTKVLSTAHIVLQSVSADEFSVDTPISRYFPQTPNNITISQLLSHSSGYPAWRPFYAAYTREIQRWETGEFRQDIFRRALQTQPEAIPLMLHRYSDIGYIILTALIEKHYGAPFQTIWKDILPVEATHGLFWGHDKAAATEDCPVRKSVMKGEVHDLNAASMGGVSGHAGLFGDVRSVAAATAWPLRALHGQISDIDPPTVENFWRFRGAGSHCLGWDTPSPVGSSASEMWPLYGVGHLGFTGCSIWIAIKEKIVVCFLSNRVHPIVEGGSTPFAPLHPRYKAFKKFRPELHRRIWKTLNAQGMV